MTNQTTLADLRPALEVVEFVLAENEAKHRDAWRSQPVEEHLRHAADHLRDARQLLGQRNAPRAHVVQELSHAATRLLFALTLATEVEAGR